MFMHIWTLISQSGLWDLGIFCFTEIKVSSKDQEKPFKHIKQRAMHPESHAHSSQSSHAKLFSFVRFSMWVSPLNIAAHPQRRPGVVWAYGLSGRATVPHLYASHTWLTWCWYWGTERYCVERSNGAVRRFRRGLSVRTADKAEEDTNAYANSLTGCACEDWGVIVWRLRGDSFVDIISAAATPKQPPPPKHPQERRATGPSRG